MYIANVNIIVQDLYISPTSKIEVSVSQQGRVANGCKLLWWTDFLRAHTPAKKMCAGKGTNVPHVPLVKWFTWLAWVSLSVGRETYTMRTIVLHKYRDGCNTFLCVLLIRPKHGKVIYILNFHYANPVFMLTLKCLMYRRPGDTWWNPPSGVWTKS